MGTETVGKVLVAARIENLGDLYQVDQGTISDIDVRRVDIPDALVDTGATMLSLPTRVIQQLGLKFLRSRPVRTSAGHREARLYGGVRLTIQGRDCINDVCEVPDDCPALIGQVPLELLDFVVDPGAQLLIGNPAHGGEHVLEMY